MDGLRRPPPIDLRALRRLRRDLLASRRRRLGVKAVDYDLKRASELAGRGAATLAGRVPASRTAVSEEAPALFHIRLPGRALSISDDPAVLRSAERNYTRIVLEGRSP